MTLQGSRAVLADMLFELGAVKFGAFRLKLHEKNPDAPLSPIYFNLRTADHPKNPGPLTPEIMHAAAVELVQLVDVAFSAFTGLPNAGEPFADEIEKIVSWWAAPPTRVRLEKVERPDGTRCINSVISGIDMPGEQVVEFDDLVTGADTKQEGAAVLEAAGAVVVMIAVLIDRMQGGREQLEAAGYKLRSVFTVEELLDHYRETGVIDQEKYNEVRAYIGL